MEYLKLKCLASEVGMGTPVQVLTGRPCKRVGEAREDIGEAKWKYGLSCNQALVGKFWDDSLTELSYLEVKGLGSYIPTLVVGCKPYPERRWQPPRRFWVEQLLWAKRSLSHQHSQQLREEIPDPARRSEQHSKSPYHTPKNKDDRKCLLLERLSKPLFKTYLLLLTNKFFFS